MSTPEERIALKREVQGFQMAKDRTYAFTCKGQSEGGGVVQDEESPDEPLFFCTFFSS